MKALIIGPFGAAAQKEEEGDKEEGDKKIKKLDLSRVRRHFQKKSADRLTNNFFKKTF